MDEQTFRDAIFAEALKQGAEFAETSYSESESFSVMVQDQQIDQYEVSTGRRLSLRVLFNGKEGLAFTEVLEDPAFLVSRAIDNARVIEDKDEHPVQGAQTYREVSDPKDPLAELDEAAKIKLAFDLEKAVLGQPDVARTYGAAVQSGRGRTSLHNSLGLSAERSSVGSSVMLAPILQRGDEVHDAYAVRWDETATDISSIAEEALEKARKRFGAASVPAGTYTILFSKEAMRSLLAGFWSVFSAEQSQKGLSFLTGLEGQEVASPLVTIVSDPLLPTNPIVFDGEGTPAKPLTLVDNGVFRSFLHNLKTALKAGVGTTGHSSTHGAGISAGNFYIQRGDTQAEHLLDLLGNGLLVDDVSGLHAGLNAVSGDFSLIAEGHLVENGQTVRPVEQITVSGNIRDLLRSITHVSDDLYFGGRGGIGSPSVIARDMKVGGR